MLTYFSSWKSSMNTAQLMQRLLFVQSPRFMIKKLQARGEARKGRGFGFVTLSSEEMQQKACAEMNGKVIDGREMLSKLPLIVQERKTMMQSLKETVRHPLVRRTALWPLRARLSLQQLKHGQSHALQLWASHQYDGPKRSSSMVYIILGLSTQYTTHFNLQRLWTCTNLFSIANRMKTGATSDLAGFRRTLAGYWWISRAVEPSSVKI